MASKFIEAGTDQTQDFTFYNATAGTVTSATDQQVTGPRSLKLTNVAGVAASATTASGILADSGRRISYFFRDSGLPAAVSNTGVGIFTSTPTNIMTVRLNTDGTMNLNPGGATQVNGTYVISINTWYWVTLSYYITNSTTFTFKLYLHDTSGNLLDTLTANAGTLTLTGSSVIRLTCGGANTNNSVWIDNVYVDDGASSSSQPDFSAPILVTNKRPNANGTTNNFVTQIGAGGSGYGSGHSPQVNEQPLSVTNGWSVINAGSAVTEEYNVENAQTGDVNIAGRAIIDYVGWVYASTLSAETGQIIVNNVASNISLTTTNTMFTAFAGKRTYPPNTGTDIGIVTDTTATTVSLYEAGIVFAYTLRRLRGHGISR